MGTILSKWLDQFLRRKKKNKVAASYNWTFSSPDLVEQYSAACQLANQGKWKEAYIAYVDIFSMNEAEELKWVDAVVTSKTRSKQRKVIDSELIGIVEVYKADCLRWLEKYDLAMKKLKDPLLTDLVKRFENLHHLKEYFQIYAVVAGELGELEEMEGYSHKAMNVAIELKDLVTLARMHNAKSRFRLRYGLDTESRELKAEDIKTRAGWNYNYSPRQNIEKDTNTVAKPRHFEVKALHVEKTLKLLNGLPAGPLLQIGGINQLLPLEQVGVTAASVIAVSYKHIGDDAAASPSAEPTNAREVLVRSLEFAKLFGATHLWMDVYCITPAGIELNEALKWMGALYAQATVYPDWAGDEKQLAAQTSGWIFQERMWTRLAIRHSTLVDSIVHLLGFGYLGDKAFSVGDVKEMTAEDLMDVMRSALTITMKTEEDAHLDEWRFLARTFIERHGTDLLSTTVRNVLHRRAEEIRKIALDLEPYVKSGRSKENRNKIEVLEPEPVSVHDVYKCVDAISKTKLKFDSEASTAYFGVFNARCNTSYSMENMPGPPDMINRVITAYKIGKTVDLLGGATEMHVLELYPVIYWGRAIYTSFGYPETERYSKIGFARQGGVAIAALLGKDNHCDTIAYGESYRHALSLIFKSQADALRLPNALKPDSDKNFESYIEGLPVERVS